MSIAALTHHHIIRTCVAFSIQHHHRHTVARTNGRHHHDRQPSLWSLQLASHASSNDSSSDGDGDSSTFCVGILGDLHIDPRKMEDYEVGRAKNKTSTQHITNHNTYHTSNNRPIKGTTAMNRLVSVLAIMSIAALTHRHHIIRTCAAFSIQHHHRHAVARTNGRHRHDRQPSPWSLQLASQASSNDSNSGGDGDGDSSTFCVGILGDLHIDPRKMEDYEAGREQWIGVFQQERQRTDNLALVSLGDLGESKNCDHNEGNPAELYSGTTLCHQVAADYLSSFDVPVGKAGAGVNAAGDGKVVEDTASTVATATVTDAPAPTVNIP
eukprot:CAMPEP_0119570246 /NCGR_PEP_ID=MMETSP1352-20130426/43518_1 /TAXON_ID=265584 /ORGANISM="Stauroneis constricta, Strain CCMP1120" /LENGTH=324 /DNA_ID=CAMNT_0007619913 /DNA_START=128 /DNA_END=1100 /DNA_ORIENTATION=-